MDLFGKQVLRERISELEDELAETQEALEETANELQRYKDRFRTAETEKQEAHRARKKAEQRVQNLEQAQARDTTTSTSTWSVRSLSELSSLVAGLQDTEFMAAHAHTAYLPADSAVLTDEATETGEIVFFDPFTTGVAITPPVPIKEHVETARTFGLEPLTQLMDGTYRYLHLSQDGAGAAVIDDQTITDHALFDGIEDTEPDTILDKLDVLPDREYDHTIVSGDDAYVDAYTEIDDPVTRRPSKVAAVSRKNDLEQAFSTAFTFETRRLTADDVERLREALF